MSGYKKFIVLKDELEKEGHIVLCPEIEFETNGDDTSFRISIQWVSDGKK